MRIPCRISLYGLEGSSSRTESIISSGAKDVCRYSKFISAPLRISIRPVDARKTFTSRTNVPICVPYAPAFIRSAPPMDPGTPIRPSIPPRSCFAQVVTVRPRSAAQSTKTELPSKRTSGSCRASCRTTQGSSPSGKRTLLPPPRKRCGTPFCFSKAINSGRDSCLRTIRTSEAPPISSEVFAASDTPGLWSMPSAAIAAINLGSLIRMIQGHSCAQQNCQHARRAAHVARADREDRVSRPHGAKQFLDALLHGAVKDDVFVAGGANRLRKSISGNAGNRLLAGGIDVHQHNHVSVIERAAKIVPQVLRACVAVRLEKNQDAVEVAAARGFQRGANFDGMVAVVVDQRDVVDHAFDVKPPPHAATFLQY